jgi:hypothetical protein
MLAGAMRDGQMGARGGEGTDEINRFVAGIRAQAEACTTKIVIGKSRTYECYEAEATLRFKKQYRSPPSRRREVSYLKSRARLR